MKITMHSLHWNNVDARVVNAQRKVFEKLGLSIEYTNENHPHGAWMTQTCRSRDSDVFVFLTQTASRWIARSSRSRLTMPSRTILLLASLRHQIIFRHAATYSQLLLFL